MNLLAAVLLEVMDKEITVPQLWSIGVVGGVLGYVAGRWRWWAALPVVALFVLVAVSASTELRDKFVGPEIIAEAGRNYPLHLIAAIGIGCILTAAGAWRHARAS